MRLYRHADPNTRLATEQLLLSQAIERSLQDLSAPLTEGSSVIVETVGFAVPPTSTSILHSDLTYVRDAVVVNLAVWDFGFILKRRSRDT